VAAILIVDDDPIFCTPFTAYLKKLGHQCQTAQAFSQGAALSRDVDFDVVFLDLLLSDAIDKNDGLIKQADKGILFLDELGELSPAAQKSILRVFQNKTVKIRIKAIWIVRPLFR
jgi:DNA-binding NtrC family response regulator